ncbi:serine hydrolase FSH [Hypoxylon sp. FL1284]|nr:serine hydrolase FSH [Hypoxylon sp. FL1284]
MRFLCLHGIGTSTNILEAQLAALRYRLGDGHEYEFVEGSVIWPPAKGIEEAFGKQEACYSYFDGTAPGILKAVDDLAEFLDSEGPFDGVIGFSQGGALAITLIAAEEKGLVQSQAAKDDDRGAHRHVKCAIVLSCGLPWDYAALRAGTIRRLTPAEDGCCVGIPTAHFWGRNDAEGHPGNGDVALLCDEAVRSEVVHTAGHGIPSGAKAEEVEAMVEAVERTIQRVL